MTIPHHTKKDSPSYNPVLIVLILALIAVIVYGTFIKERNEARLNEHNSQLYSELCKKQGGNPLYANDPDHRTCLVGNTPINVIQP